ncbi:MAG: hypothetical protein RL616_749, partial [Verrucomicrobiota bacterium]
MKILSIFHLWRPWFFVLTMLLLPLFARAQFTFVTNADNTITITGYTGATGFPIIPSTTNGYPVTAIASNAFVANPHVLGMTIPDSVTTIGMWAFAQTSLSRISIGNGVTNIGAWAFFNLGLLNNVIIPNSVTGIDENAFRLCSLTNVVLGTNLAVIGNSAFIFCSALKSVTFPSSLISIGTNAFKSCVNLHQAYFMGNAPLVNGGPGSADRTVFTNTFSGGTVFYLPGTTGWGSTFGNWPTAVGAFQKQPSLFAGGSNFGVQSNHFNFAISWATNTPVVVEASTNLLG